MISLYQYANHTNIDINICVFCILISPYKIDKILYEVIDRMAYNEAQKRATAKYQKKAYETILLRVKKGEKEIITEQAEKKGLSVNSYIIGLIKKDIENGD